MTKKVKRPVEEDVYTIDRIVDYREGDDGPQWRIRWKNYSAADDTWEPEENIITGDAKIRNDMLKMQQEYWSRRLSAAAASSRSRKSEVQSKSRNSEPPVTTTTRLSSAPKATSAAKVRKTDQKPRIAHIRKIPNRNDDFYCVVASKDGEEKMLVSEARNIYYNELIDYLLKRVKFAEPAND